jgi:hypothetical protein
MACRELEPKAEAYHFSISRIELALLVLCWVATCASAWSVVSSWRYEALPVTATIKVNTSLWSISAALSYATCKRLSASGDGRASARTIHALRHNIGFPASRDNYVCNPTDAALLSNVFLSKETLKQNEAEAIRAYISSRYQTNRRTYVPSRWINYGTGSVP